MGFYSLVLTFNNIKYNKKQRRVNVGALFGKIYNISAIYEYSVEADRDWKPKQRKTL